jgi:hypothetical protein
VLVDYQNVCLKFVCILIFVVYFAKIYDYVFVIMYEVTDQVLCFVEHFA